MKGKLIFKIIETVIGKNSAHLARKLQTYIGGLLIGSVAVTGAIDPGIASEIPAEDFSRVTAAEIEDGLTLGEIIRLMIGFILFFASRAMSFFRARNLDIAAEWFGMIVGRGIHSLTRALLTLSAGFLSWLGFSGGTEEGLLSVPFVDILVAVIAFVVAGISSRFQDGKANPVSSSPPKNKLDVIDSSQLDAFNHQADGI